QALANANLGPGEVDAVEAHGTGTALGDPIEASAILATYGQERERPLKLGSLKSNIGHTQAAAGVGGVIKMVMAMREGVLPRTLHIDKPSSKVDWDSGRIELLTEQASWQANGHPRRAGVSSFGISGTNAHVILEEAPEPRRVGEGAAGAPSGQGASSKTATAPLPGPFPLVFSAKSEPALRAQAERLGVHLRGNPELGLSDVAYSLATSRSAFEQRAVVLGASREQLLDGLEALGRGERPPGTVLGSAPAAANPVFLFSGHGSQWQGMALELLESSPAFARHMGECEQALSPFVEWSLPEVLHDRDGRWLEQVDVVQPVIFSTMVSLARLWQELGVQPSAVVGHSQGEIAAAHIAGGLSLEDAARLAALRSRMIAGLAGQGGGMISIGISTDRLGTYLEPWQGRIEVAAINSPSSSVLSGDRESLDELLQQCSRDEIRARNIRGAVAASHSVQIEVLREELLEALAQIAPCSGEIPFYSTVTGGLLDTAQLDAEYWYKNTRRPVLFEQVTRALIEQGHEMFIEVSSHPVLLPAVEETIEASAADPGGVAVLGTLRREEGGPERFALSLAEAHASGAPVDWQKLFVGTGAMTTRLPTYPFQRKRYWLSLPTDLGDPSSLGQASAEHPLLSAALDDPEGERLILTGRLSLQADPWLADHAAFGTALFPGAGFLELALNAGVQVGARKLDELTLQAPMILPEQGALQLRVEVAGPGEDGRREVAIHSRSEAALQGEWTCHASGFLSEQDPAMPEPDVVWPPRGAQPIETTGLYERMAEMDFDYGPAFQGLRAAWRSGEELFAEVSLDQDQLDRGRGFGLHPALLDAAFHTIALRDGLAEPRFPFSFAEVALHASGATQLRVSLTGGDEGFCLALADGNGSPVAEIGSMRLRQIDSRQLALEGAQAQSLCELAWKQVELDSGPAADWRTLESPSALAELAELAEGDAAPDLVVYELAVERTGSLAADARTGTLAALRLIQDWLAEERFAASRLILCTERAVAVADGESPDLVAAPAWGLLRAAQTEHPGRFVLVDSDGSDASRRALPLALATEETQLALRDGAVLVPRVARMTPTTTEGPAAFVDPERTVLISGGLSGIGAVVARRLAEAHGARHLLLASRSGESADRAGELRVELEGLGATVRIAACDVSDREQLAGLIASIPAAHPLGAIVHSAGVLADGVVESMAAEQVERVFAPKVDAAWHLHELTEEMDLTAFVLFSSFAGAIGAPGQANYAAANVFLDALAAHRRSRGLPGTALAWGLWAGASTSNMGTHLG
ncbi:MAG TPA: type I polyketide synthase, partial [Solirubrobacterales bacterium]